jgi:ligand-binding SRPBCC domain-containing protein
MNILIKTTLSKNYREVHRGFDLKLFKALKPPLIALEVKRFDGCKKGDEVHLEIGLGPLKQKWVSLITENIENENECTFVDIGHILPPPLKDWKHTHRILKINEQTCEIHDDIHFSSGNKLLDLFLYPALYAQFAFRIPVYKKFFK